jgi:isopentenyl diphosphate isomerase/L-lactate dehydrogenase-like FMN-dependent dehydrogenase
VLIGRPYIYGLALDGQRGARIVMRRLVDDLEDEVRKAGHRSHRTLSRSSLTRAR